MFGDSLFAFGALVLGWFVLGLVTGHSYDKTVSVPEEKWKENPALVAAGDD